MKYFLTLLLLGAFTSFGQMLSGDLKDSGRKKVSDTPYVLESHTSGFVTYEITVNNEGNVTAARLVGKKTTVRSTPARMKTRDHVMKFKFEKGNHYPKFQTVVIKITLVKPK